MPFELVETDPTSGAKIYLLIRDDRPSDNIYCEQPYSDNAARRIALRYYREGILKSGISIFDLSTGNRGDILVGQMPFPAFFAWGRSLYFHEMRNGGLWLRRCDYSTFKTENVALLPCEKGRYSYGTVSPDERYYAVSIQKDRSAPSKVHLLELDTGAWRVLFEYPGYHIKHEQFSRDGRNRVLVQLNAFPGSAKVFLCELNVDGSYRFFPQPRPHSPRPTGHEAWIGSTGRIVFSTRIDSYTSGNLWTSKAGEKEADLLIPGRRRFGHVSASSCGKYWVADAGEEDGVPVYMGSFYSGSCKRLLSSRTVFDGNQWTHAHPYLTADNRWLIFTSNRGGYPQVYGARLADGWLDDL